MQETYCNRCGKKMQPHYSGCCNRCLSVERMKNMSVEEFWEDRKAANKKVKKMQRKKEAPVLILVLIGGFIFPIIWIGYAIYKLWPTVKQKMLSPKSRYSSTGGYFGGEGGSGGYSTGTSDSNYSTPSGSGGTFGDGDRKFTFKDPSGNIHESGSVFIDWAGNHCEWGVGFIDSRGNWIKWGSPFYDGRDCLVEWGSPFYDAKGNYINPLG